MTATSEQELKPQQRLAAYWETLKSQKERKTVRELLEREVLQRFISINKERINEFPLLSSQQQTIIDFLTTRGQGDPLHEHTSALIASFINQLNKYGGLLTVGDTAAAEEDEPDLLNQESLLLKAIQSVVYTTALTLDNFTEVLIQHYGEEALGPIDTIMEQEELGERFWKDCFSHFIGKLVDCAYREITANQQYTLRRERSQIVIRFNFDDIVGRLKRTEKAVEKTRAQSMFEEGLHSFEARTSRKLLTEHLTRIAGQPEYPFNTADIPHLAHIVCMDPTGESFSAAAAMLSQRGAAPENAPEEGGEAMTREKAKFIQDQALTMACAAAVSLNTIRQDIQKALFTFESKEAAHIMTLLGVFELASVERAFFAMLEFQFLAILRQRAGEDVGKLQFRTMRLRRVREADLAPLADEGLNRIRKNKIWLKDPDSESCYIFSKQQAREFKELVDLMHMEPKLARSVIGLWQKGQFKVFITVSLNLDLIARTTTNLNQRLSEIFMHLGTLGPGRQS